MSDLSITAASVALVRGDEVLTAPAAEAITAGQVVRLDTSTGKFTKANATSDAEARWFGVAVGGAAAGFPVTAVRRGLVDLGNALGGMAYDADVYLSNTDGALADASVGRNEVQTIAITGTPSGGTFTLTYAGQTTAAIAYNAAASAVKSALVALSNIEDDDIVCAGGALPGSAVTVTFQGGKAKSDIALMTADGASLTGGSSPEVAVTTSTAPYLEKVVGRVVPAFGATTADKLLMVQGN